LISTPLLFFGATGEWPFLFPASQCSLCQIAMEAVLASLKRQSV
jgi:hypothetical protein